MLTLLKDTLAGLLLIVGLLFAGLYGYQLVSGPSLKPNTTYRETETAFGKEVGSKIFHTLSAEEIHRRTLKFFLSGVGLLASGVLIGFWPKKWSPVVLAIYLSHWLMVRRQRRNAEREGDGQPMSEEEARQFVAQIPEQAEKTREIAMNLYGIELDYSPESIPKLDRIIKEGWPKKPPVLLGPVVVGFGSYLGEAIRHSHGGDWCFSEEYGIHLDVGGLGIKIFPFAKVQKRFLNGEEDSIGHFYSFIRFQVDQARNPT